MTKKLFKANGQAATAVGAIVTLIVGMGVSVLVLIFVGALGGQTYQLVESDIDAIGVGAETAANESFTALNLTAVSLTHSWVESGSLTIYNATTLVGLSNFTVDYTAGTLTLIDGTIYNNTILNASYDYANRTIGNTIKNSILSGFEALEQTGDFLPIIVLAVVISLVLSLVLGFTNLGGGPAVGGTAL